VDARHLASGHAHDFGDDPLGDRRGALIGVQRRFGAHLDRCRSAGVRARESVLRAMFGARGTVHVTSNTVIGGRRSGGGRLVDHGGSPGRRWWAVCKVARCPPPHAAKPAGDLHRRPVAPLQGSNDDRGWTGSVEHRQRRLVGRRRPSHQAQAFECQPPGVGRSAGPTEERTTCSDDGPERGERCSRRPRVARPLWRWRQPR